MSDDDDDFGILLLFEMPAGWIGLVLVILIVAAVYWVNSAARHDKCMTYGRETGREVKIEGRECYVRSGDHFVPREEYRQ